MTQPQACDASVISHLTDPPVMVGPCVLRQGHDGSFHKAASGASWVAQHRFTLAPHDPEAERAATERAIQAAADSEKAAAWHRKVTSGSADGPLVLDRAAAIVMRDCLNQLLGDEATDDGALRQQIADAEATIARVRELAGWWAKRTDQLKRGAELLTAALNGPAGW